MGVRGTNIMFSAKATYILTRNGLCGFCGQTDRQSVRHSDGTGDGTNPTRNDFAADGKFWSATKRGGSYQPRQRTAGQQGCRACGKTLPGSNPGSRNAGADRQGLEQSRRSAI